MLDPDEYNQNVQRLTRGIDEANKRLNDIARQRNNTEMSTCPGRDPWCNGVSCCDKWKHERRIEHNADQKIAENQKKEAKQALFDYQAEVQRIELQNQIDAITAALQEEIAIQKAQIAEVNPVIPQQIILTHNTQAIEPVPEVATRPQRTDEEMETLRNHITDKLEMKEVSDFSFTPTVQTAVIAAALFVGLPILQRAL